MTPGIHGRPPVAIEMFAAIMKADPERTWGPLVATFVSTTIMLGVFLTQVAKYFSAFGYESLWMFVLVISCIILNLWQWITLTTLIWDWFVMNYGDWSGIASMPWPLWMLVLVSRFNIFVCQTFFAYRCYMLYNRSKPVLAGILLGMLASLALSSYGCIAIGIDPFNFDYWAKFGTPPQVLSLATDVAITGLTLWQLSRGGNERQGIRRNTVDVLKRLRNAVAQAAAPPALLALVTTIAGFGWKTMSYEWLAMLTASLYVWSLMFTLNSRIALRKVFNSPDGTENVGELPVSTRIEFANPKSGRPDAERTTFLLSPVADVTLLTTSIRRGAITDLEQQLGQDRSAESLPKPRKPRRHSESSVRPSKALVCCPHCDCGESTWSSGSDPR